MAKFNEQPNIVMTARKKRLAIVALLGLALLIVAALAWRFHRASLPQDVFDKLVTKDLIESGTQNPVPFSLTTGHGRERLVYRADFDLGTADPGACVWVTITVARAGALLDPAEYRQKKAEIERSDSKRPSDERWAPYLLPDIGKQALAGFAIGPGGGGDFVVFTTNDGRYDIEVSQGNHPSETPKPVVMCEQIARQLCDRYEAYETR